MNGNSSTFYNTNRTSEVMSSPVYIKDYDFFFQLMTVNTITHLKSQGKWNSKPFFQIVFDIAVFYGVTDPTSMAFEHLVLNTIICDSRRAASTDRVQRVPWYIIHMRRQCRQKFIPQIWVCHHFAIISNLISNLKVWSKNNICDLDIQNLWTTHKTSKS